MDAIGSQRGLLLYCTVLYSIAELLLVDPHSHRSSLAPKLTCIQPSDSQRPSVIRVFTIDNSNETDRLSQMIQITGSKGI
jgi:hypothetical protein